MISKASRDALSLRINNVFPYGWLMLGVGAFGMFASGPGQSHMFSVFVTPISDDLNISRTSLSFAYAIATLIAALGLPFVGRLVDRCGARIVLIWVSALFGLSAVLFGAVANLALLALGFGALRFLGQGSLMLCSSNLVAQWFRRKRGFALSLMSLGFALSMAVHPPLAQWLTAQVGWREAWMWLGVMTWVSLLPLAIGLVQNKPEDLNLLPDGAVDNCEATPRDDAPEPRLADVGLTLKEALRTPAFWIVAVALSTLSMLVTGMFFHQVSIFENAALSRELAAEIFSISAVTMVVAMPIMGRMLDRLPTRPMLAGGLAIMSGALLCLMFVDDLPSAVVYAIVFGIANAAIHTNMTFVWPHFFGRKHLGSIQGAAQTVGVVGASLGPLPLAIAYDMFQSYSGALAVLAVLPIICAVPVLYFQPPKLVAEVETA